MKRRFDFSKGLYLQLEMGIVKLDTFSKGSSEVIRNVSMVIE